MPIPLPIPSTLDIIGCGGESIAEVYYLTVRDVRRLLDGEKLVLLCLDRNVWDFLSRHEPNRTYSVNTLFQNNYFVEFTKRGNSTSIEGEWVFMPRDEGDKGVDTRPFDYLNKVTRIWEPWRRNRMTPELFDSTYLGWRGHMIRWDIVVKRFPFVTYLKPSLVDDGEIVISSAQCWRRKSRACKPRIRSGPKASLLRT